jgi:DNA (cytosine-5)-methyltransferase 1
MKPTAIDLFAGCGGLTQGLKDAGFCVVAGVEIDALAQETYHANHPEVALWGDITEVNTLSMKRRLHLRKGQLDLLAGCPPCQGFTALRTLNGKRHIDDPRNDLVLEFARFVRDFLPRAVMFENVPRLEQDRRFAELLKDLAALGYGVDCDVLNAADFGVPQRRKRLILVAVRNGTPALQRSGARSRTVREALSQLGPAGSSGDPMHDIPERRAARVLAIIQSTPRDGGSRNDLPSEAQLRCHQRCDGFKDVYGRLAWDRVAPTITGGCVNPSKGRFLHPSEDRAITLREAALLQGFPADYAFSLRNGKFAAAAMIGNALPPAVAEHQARALRQMLSMTSRNRWAC